MSLVLGLNAVTTRNTAEDLSAPAWSIVTNIKDETLNMETALSDVTTRKANGWRQQVGTLSEASVDAQIMYDTEDADFTAFQQAFFNKEIIEMGFWDGDPDATGSTIQGLTGGFGVTNFSIGRQLEEAMMVDVTFTVREDVLGDGPTWQSVTNP